MISKYTRDVRCAQSMMYKIIGYIGFKDSNNSNKYARFILRFTPAFSLISCSTIRPYLHFTYLKSSIWRCFQGHLYLNLHHTELHAIKWAFPCQVLEDSYINWFPDSHWNLIVNICTPHFTVSFSVTKWPFSDQAYSWETIVSKVDRLLDNASMHEIWFALITLFK